MSQDLVLNVTVPPECEVGSIINVLFEGKYYQVTVPEGAPGKTIEVTVPAAEQQASQQAAADSNTASAPPLSGGGNGDSPSAGNETSTESTITVPNKYTLVFGGTATIGLFILLPIIGCITVIGVAAVAYYNTNNDPNLGAIQPYVKTAVEATSAAMQYVEDKTAIGQKVSDATSGIRTKINEFDEKHKIYENTSAVVSPIASRTREIFEATPGKIVQASQWTFDKTIELNETYGVSTKVGNAMAYGLGLLEQLPPALSKASDSIFRSGASLNPASAQSETDSSNAVSGVEKLSSSSNSSDGQTGGGSVDPATPVDHGK